MAKPAITKYSVKGSPLTTSELDTNFQNIVDATVSITAGSGGTAVSTDLNGNITLVAGTNVTLSGDNTAKTITINSTASGGGGTVNTGAASMLAYYPSAGTTVDDVGNIKYSSTASAQELRVDGSTTASQLWLRAGGYGGDNEAIIKLSYAELLTIKPPTNNPGVVVEGTTLIVGTGTSNSTVRSNGNYDLILKTGNTDTGTITIADGANQNISIVPNGTGSVVLDYATFPNADGSNGQVLSTNGSGALSWKTAGGTVNSSLNAGRLTYYQSSGSAVSPTTSSVTYNGTDTLSSLKVQSGTVGDITNGCYIQFSNTQSGWIQDPVTAGWGTSEISMNGFIQLTPSTITSTGVELPVYIQTDDIIVGSGANAIITTSSSINDLTLNTNSGTNTGSIKINAGVDGNIEIITNGSGHVAIDADLNLITGVISTSSANTTIEIEPSGTGVVYLNGPIKTNTTSGTPSNTSTVVTWLKVDIGGTTYYLPAYQ